MLKLSHGRMFDLIIAALRIGCNDPIALLLVFVVLGDDFDMP